MYTSIDLDGLRFVHAHPDLRAVQALADIELAHTSVLIVELETVRDLDRFTVLELQKLLESTTGAPATGLPNRHAYAQALFGAAKELTSRDVNVFEVIAAAKYAMEKYTDGERLRYVKGHPLPELMAELWEPASAHSRSDLHALRAAGAAADPTPAPASGPAAAPPAAPAPQPGARVARVARAPASAQSGPATRPASGSTTGRVWDIADAAFAQSGATPTKEFRRDVIARCEAAGINKSTASVQYGRWLSSRL